MVQTNRPVLKTINKLNSRNGAKSINTFGFSTLYAKLTHDKLRTELQKLIDLTLKTKNVIF